MKQRIIQARRIAYTHRMDEQHDERLVYSVSGLVQEARECLELSFPLLWVEGEISNLSQPASGHWYFTLKDESAQLRCAMFKGRNRLVDMQPQQGDQVLVRGRIGIYQARGEFQMVVEHMEEAGAGALQRAFEQLKARLQKEGLFDESHKQPLPGNPRRIGVITSATGAAIRDILSVLRRRYPLGELIIYPVPVQGEAAAPAIVRALAIAAQRNECDVLILARGGGSLEDLWAFNEEAVARAIHACPLPTVSGVGHEVDFTIADFVADQRAPTPSAAAELVSPDIRDWQQQLLQRLRQLQRGQNTVLEQRGQGLNWLLHRLQQQHPGRRLEQHMQRLDEVEQRLLRSQQNSLQQRRHQLERLQAGLKAASPAHRIENGYQRTGTLLQQLTTAMQQRQQRQAQRLAVAGRALDSLSPLQTLARGYAIATDSQGRNLTRAQQARTGDELRLRLLEGALDCSVTAVHAAKNRPS